MAVTVRERLVDILSKHPGGMTTEAVAVYLGRSRNAVSSMLSKGVCYGYVDREYRVENRRRFAVWHAPDRS